MKGFILLLSHYWFISSSTTYIRLSPENCNVYYNVDNSGITLANNQPVTPVTPTEYFEIEFDLEIDRLCRNPTGNWGQDSTCGVLQIGRDDHPIWDRYPVLFIGNAPRGSSENYWYTRLAIEEDPICCGEQINFEGDTSLTAVGSHHIYVSMTPTRYMVEIDGIRKSIRFNRPRFIPFQPRGYPLFLSQAGYRATAGTVSNICVRSSDQPFTPSPTPEPTVQPTEICDCYNIQLVSIQEIGPNKCYRYEVDFCDDAVDYIVLGRGNAGRRCGLSDISGIIDTIQVPNDVTTMLNYDEDGVNGLRLDGLKDGERFRLCFDKTVVSGTLDRGNVYYGANSMDYKCPEGGILFDLCGVTSAAKVGPMKDLETGALVENGSESMMIYIWSGICSFLVSMAAVFIVYVWCIARKGNDTVYDKIEMEESN